MCSAFYEFSFLSKVITANFVKVHPSTDYDITEWQSYTHFLPGKAKLFHSSEFRQFKRGFETFVVEYRKLIRRKKIEQSATQICSDLMHIKRVQPYSTCKHVQIPVNLGCRLGTTLDNVAREEFPCFKSTFELEESLTVEQALLCGYFLHFL